MEKGAMRREVNMKALYKVMILMAVVLFIGTAGAVDNEIIPLGMAALQIVFGPRPWHRRRVRMPA